MSTKPTSTRPDKVRILGKVFSVDYVSGRPLEADDMGECDSDKQQITIRSGQSLQSEQDTFLHECLHAIEAAQQIRLSHDDVHRLTTGIHALLRDNPKIIAYLARRK